ncbi:MAG: hypothetical protein ACJAWP_000423 [Porticoccus sp.]|jgi:hypothetical protein|tara:strand:- start:6488 stop:6769 length:282 start_codon:yes stop_codon:yes gene_type:complete
MKAYSTFARSTTLIILNTPTRKDPQAAIVHTDRNGGLMNAFGLRELAANVTVDIQSVKNIRHPGLCVAKEAFLLAQTDSPELLLKRVHNHQTG